MWDLAAISAAAHTGRIMEDRDRERERESDTHTHTEEGTVAKEMIEGRFQLTYSARRGEWRRGLGELEWRRSRGLSRRGRTD